jgi:hypothetical protein
MRNYELSDLEKLKLRGISNNYGLSGEVSKGLRVIAIPKRDDQLCVKAVARFRDEPKYGWLDISGCP